MNGAEFLGRMARQYFVCLKNRIDIDSNQACLSIRIALLRVFPALQISHSAAAFLPRYTLTSAHHRHHRDHPVEF
jgi:hypothetical protein